MARDNHRTFEQDFPDDDACLEWLKDQIFPDGILCEPCGRVTKHHRVRSRRSYSCDRCGHHVHPTAGTIYHKSRTPLTKWFYATYLLSSVDPDIPITELQRELGVTYKTAWRMTHLILGMLSEDEEEEVGETVRDRDEVNPPRSRSGGLLDRITRRDRSTRN
ncbi:MAG: transposase [Dehalococcoidia bacterium]|nr:transposase [Dehalococcoidia bacterium]